MVATKIKSKMNLAAHRHDDLGGKIGESSTPPMVAQILHRTRHFRDRYSDDFCYIASLTMSSGVKYFLRYCSLHSEERAISLSLKMCVHPTKARSQSVSGQELSPTHASLRSQRRS